MVERKARNAMGQYVNDILDEQSILCVQLTWQCQGGKGSREVGWSVGGVQAFTP